jgi:hypothetical protein
VKDITKRRSQVFVARIDVTACDIFAPSLKRARNGVGVRGPSHVLATEVVSQI